MMALSNESCFEFVSAGYHTVTVLENNGCSNPIVKSNILVIDYPRFFTPNGDGYNESWNILSLEMMLVQKFEYLIDMVNYSRN
jgi:hypothetical protein